MTQPATSWDTQPLLAKLLRQELSKGTLGETLGASFENLHKYWEAALLHPLTSMAERQGKEIRARLLTIAWKLVGARDQPPDELIGIAEALHLGSLIVDDIEDGSKMRRGGPCLHEFVGLPLALNAANWLYFWPTLLIDRLQLAPRQELQLRRTVETGILRCHFGQALDLNLRVCDLKQSDILQAVRATSELKTGCLMELAARTGAIAGGGNAASTDALGDLGRSLGLALQMLDDLTSIATARRAQKGREDLLLGRPTWPWAWFAGQADEVAYSRLRSQEELVAAGKLDPSAVAATLNLHVAALGRAEIARHLAVAIGQARAQFGDGPGVSDLHALVGELRDYEG